MKIRFPLLTTGSQSGEAYKWVIAPLVDRKHPFGSLHKVGYRYLVVHTPARSNMTGRVVELVLPETIQEPQAAQYALQATKLFLNTGRFAVVPGLSGWVLLYSPTYCYQTGVVYQDGVAQPKRVEIQAKKRTPSVASLQQLNSNSSTTPTSFSFDNEAFCFIVTTCGTVDGVDGGCISYTVCDDTGGGGGGGDGGWGGGGGAPAPVPGDTPELRQFEIQYRNRMSVSELAIFDSSMSHWQQVKYLGNAKFAEDLAKKDFPDSFDKDGNGDAFRHAIFAANNKNSLGLPLATQLGTAHENIPINSCLDQLRHDMDVHNNREGWNIDTSNDIYTSVMTLLNNGKLQIISSFGTLTPSHP